MKLNLTVFTFFLLFTYQSNSYEIPRSKLRVSAIDWCPQICPSSKNKPGYVVEIMQLLLRKSDLSLHIDIYPWSRAIKYVTQGNYSALLSPAKKEAPSLIYPRVPIGIQKMCFFTLADSTWRYKGSESLKGISIGVADGTSLEELSEYHHQNQHQFQSQPYHERFLIQNIKKLVKGRIDTFIFSRNTTLLETNNMTDPFPIRMANCVSDAPIYVAFTSNKKFSKIINQVIQRFDTEMLNTITQREVEFILAKYDVGFKVQDLLFHQKM